MAQNYILAWSLEIRAHAIRPQSIVKFKSLFLVSWVVKLLQISFDNVLFDQIQINEKNHLLFHICFKIKSLKTVLNYNNEITLKFTHFYDNEEGKDNERVFKVT